MSASRGARMPGARLGLSRLALVAALVSATCVSGAAAVGPTVELPAGGLVFPSQDRIQVEREELTIALDRIEITYALRLIEALPLSVAVAFPLPLLDMSTLAGAPIVVPAGSANGDGTNA